MPTDERIPEPIQQLIFAGKQKVGEYENQKREEWNKTVAQIEDNWNEIEKLVKQMLPVEIRDFFVLDKDKIFDNYDDENRRGGHSITLDDVSKLKSQCPEISAIGKEGTISIPQMNKISVLIKDSENGRPIISYRAKGTGFYYIDEVEQDGSLEVALYYAKQFYDNDPRPHVDEESGSSDSIGA